jgi:hypothetical protein
MMNATARRVNGEDMTAAGLECVCILLMLQNAEPA